jgi:hypothetical protein
MNHSPPQLEVIIACTFITSYRPMKGQPEKVQTLVVYVPAMSSSGNGRGTFRAPSPTRFPGHLGWRASGPISCCYNDMPREHGRREGSPRVSKSETK